MVQYNFVTIHFNTFFFRNVFWLQPIESLAMDKVYFTQPFAICPCFFFGIALPKDS